LKWYAIYTKPRWEKKVHNLLIEKGVDSYCPLNRVPRKWSDRIKVVEEPLFKSYVFVRVEESQRTDVRMVNGVVNFVYWNGKPALIRDREIDAIKRFLNEHTDVQVIAADLKPEDTVLITAGPLMNKEGAVVEVKNKVAKVLIESLGFILVASIDKTKLVSLNKL
jgi:transcription antitermination factor NusG